MPLNFKIKNILTSWWVNMETLALEKALNAVKMAATLAAILNITVIVAIAYRYVTKQSMRVQ